MQFLEESSLLGEQVSTAEAAIELLERADLAGETHATELVGHDEQEIRVKAVEAKTGFASHPPDQALAVRLAGVPPARRACTHS